MTRLLLASTLEYQLIERRTDTISLSDHIDFLRKRGCCRFDRHIL